MVDAGAPELSSYLKFRHVVVGKLTYPAVRLTWRFLRDAVARGRVVLGLDCQEMPGSLSLTGKENNDALWDPAVHVEYRGAAAHDNAYELVAVAVPPKGRRCSGFPPTLQLSCRAERVATLSAGAALIPAKHGSENGRARWRPAGRKAVTAERCNVTVPRGFQSFVGDVMTEWPLMFVPETPIEWAYENSDLIVQEGAYRFLP